MSRSWILPLLLASACKGRGEDTGGDGEWIVPAVDLGADQATGEGYVVSNGSDAWFAAEHLAPGLEWSFPATDIPMYLWELVQAENIGDDWCPYVTADASAGTQTWRSDCRSQNGYIFTGSIEQSWPTGSTPEWDWERWDLDLEVVGDVEDAAFDSLVLRGVIYFVNGDDDDLVKAAQVNLTAGVDAYWEQRHVGDAREASWYDLRLSARYEHLPGDVHHFEGSADLGEDGGLRFASSNLTAQDTCAGEPKGRLDLWTDQEVVLSFQGAGECDRCAKLVIDDEYAGQACDL